MQEWFSKFIRSKVFAVLFCILGVGFILYLSNRLGLIIKSFFALNLRPIILLILSVICFYMLIYVNIKKEEKKTRKLFNLFSIIFCFFPSAILSFLLFDGIKLIFHLDGGKLYLFPLLFALGLSGYGFAHAKKIYIKEYTIPIKCGTEHINSDLTAVLLSDIHAGSYVNRRQFHKIIHTVNQIRPDLVFIAGDTFDQDAFGHCDMEGIQAELQQLHPKGHIYAVLGNHDPNSSHSEVRTYFEKAGVHLLIDECIDTENFLIVGRDDILGNPSRTNLSELIHINKVDKSVLVIDHNPLGIEDGIEAGAALILCGHTHRGQFFPATLFTKWAYGKRGFYGHFQTENSHSIVTSGAGYFQLPIRIGTNSEVVAIHINLFCDLNNQNQTQKKRTTLIHEY